MNPIGWCINPSMVRKIARMVRNSDRMVRETTEMVHKSIAMVHKIERGAQNRKDDA